jgi:hypothetical protein
MLLIIRASLFLQSYEGIQYQSKGKTKSVNWETAVQKYFKYSTSDNELQARIAELLPSLQKRNIQTLTQVAQFVALRMNQAKLGNILTLFAKCNSEKSAASFEALSR